MSLSDGDGTERHFTAAMVRAAINRGENPLSANRHIAALAKRGASAPTELTADEVKDVCFAYVLLARKSDYIARIMGQGAGF